MAAWQPIQMPGSNAADQVSDFFKQRADRKRTEKLDAAALAEKAEQTKRLKQQDFQLAYQAASKLAAQGDLEGARALMAPYAAELVDAPQGGAQAMPQGAAQTPMPQMAPQGQPQSGPPIPEGNDYDGFQQEPTQPQNPLLAAHQATKARDQQRARILRFRDPMGGQGTMDPTGMAEARRTAKAERLDSAFSQTDELTQGLYRQMRPTLLATDQDVDPTDVFRFIQQEKSAQAKAAHDKAAEEARLASENRRYEWEATKEEGREKRSLRNANRPFVITPDKQIDNERAAASAFGAERSRWEKENNVEQLTDSYDKFAQLSSATQKARATGDTIAMNEALYTTARYIVGPGVLTQNEYDATVSKTAGAVSSALTKLRRNMDGSIDPEERAALEKFVSNARGAIKARAVKAVQNYDLRFSDKTIHRRTAPQEVDASRDSIIARFGLSPKDLGGSAGTKKPVTTPADSAAVKWARANPTHPRAKEILSENGLEK